MKTFFKYIKPFWFFALLAPLTMIGEVIADLFQPQFMANIIDKGINLETPNLEVIYKNGAYMIIALALGGLCGFLSAVFASITAQKFANSLRKDCFEKVMNLSFEQTDKFTTGSLVTRITNDITILQDMVSMLVRMVIRMIMLFVGGIVCMIGTNEKFIIILMIILPIEILLVAIFVKVTKPLFIDVQNRLDNINIVMQENVTGARVVKAYVKEEYESNRFSNVNEKLCNIMLKVQKLMAFVNPVMMLFIDAAIIFIIYVGGNEVFGGTMQVGEVSKALTYIMQILMSVISMGMFFQSITRAAASMNRINAILNSEPTIKDGSYVSENFEGNIKFENVDFIYPNGGSKPILKNINLEVNKGSSLAVLGATGSGKTSLINLIMRFYDTSSGNVMIDDVNIKDYDLKNLRSNISLVSQKTELFTGSIYENLCWGKKDATYEEVIEACKIAQADEFINGFTNGYDTIIGEKGSSLSGGQKQRLSIARAIIKNPAILIFDDATSALDLATEAKLYAALREKLKDTTFVLIAQRVASAKGAEKIIVIDKGTIAAYGTNDELLENSEIYRDIYYSQLKTDSEAGEENE